MRLLCTCCTAAKTLAKTAIFYWKDTQLTVVYVKESSGSWTGTAGDVSTTIDESFDSTDGTEGSTGSAGFRYALRSACGRTRMPSMA